MFSYKLRDKKRININLINKLKRNLNKIIEILKIKNMKKIKEIKNKSKPNQFYNFQKKDNNLNFT